MTAGPADRGRRLSADIARAMTVVAAAIEALSDEDVTALLTGQARLEFVRVTATDIRSASASAPASTRSPHAGSGKATQAAQIRDRLRHVSTEDEAVAYLKGLGLKVAELRTLAAELGVRPTKSTGSAIIGDLVKVFVTGRLTTAAVRRF